MDAVSLQENAWYPAFLSAQLISARHCLCRSKSGFSRYDMRAAAVNGGDRDSVQSRNHNKLMNIIKWNEGLNAKHQDQVANDPSLVGFIENLLTWVPGAVLLPNEIIRCALVRNFYHATLDNVRSFTCLIDLGRCAVYQL